MAAVIYYRTSVLDTDKDIAATLVRLRKHCRDRLMVKDPELIIDKLPRRYSEQNNLVKLLESGRRDYVLVTTSPSRLFMSRVSHMIRVMLILHEHNVWVCFIDRETPKEFVKSLRLLRQFTLERKAETRTIGARNADQKQGRPRIYIDIEEVVRLRDRMHVTFTDIAIRLDLNRTTLVKRYHEYMRRQKKG